MDSYDFSSAISFLSNNVMKMLLQLPEEIKEKTYEIRLRTEKPITLISSDGTIFIDKKGRPTYIYSGNLYSIQAEEMRDSFNRLCNFSVYSHSDSISQGFITLKGGHRVGLSGTAVTENGHISAIRDINSLNIRIAREFKGCADEVLKKAFENKMKNVIIAGPPSSGKTTLLRDIARQISSGRFGEYYKVAVVDERCEIFPVSDGVCSCDTGANTDVLSSFKKADGIMTALRTLSPQLIICDEIGTVDECYAINSGLNSGVNFVLSIHAASSSELKNKLQFKTLLESGISAKVVILSYEPCRVKEIFETGEINAQNMCVADFGNGIRDDRSAC